MRLWFTVQPQSSLFQHSQLTWESDEEEPSNYLYPCPRDVLDKLLEESARRFPQKYGELLDRTDEMRQVLLNLLRKEALNLFEGRNYSKEKYVIVCILYVLILKR